MLNKHIAEYVRVRGWEPRRIYLDPVQYTQLIKCWASLAAPAHIGGFFEGRQFKYMSTMVYIVTSCHVAAKLREWDLAP